MEISPPTKIVLLVFLGLLVSGCNAKESFLDPIKPDFENISFNVVQKQLIIEPNLPSDVKDLVSKWFDQKIKINGFDGDMKFMIPEYSEEISSINDGKRVDISLSFNVIINKPSLSQTKKIEGYVSSYGTLTGNFSLAEFDKIIQNTQTDLVLRLSRDLKSKI